MKNVIKAVLRWLATPPEPPPGYFYDDSGNLCKGYRGGSGGVANQRILGPGIGSLNPPGEPYRKAYHPIGENIRTLSYITKDGDIEYCEITYKVTAVEHFDKYRLEHSLDNDGGPVARIWVEEVKATSEDIMKNLVAAVQAGAM